MVVGFFVVLRRLETWLHQHIFKVGWLITKNYQTTTTLYYTFLLPGVVLHEFVYWLTAGFLNVRADRVFQWPQLQQIGKLELSFVKLAKNTSPFQTTIISVMPFVVGSLSIWLMANYVFRLPEILAIIAPGTLPDVMAGLRALLETTDFWMWFYLAFAIANTMTPDLRVLGGLRVMLPAAGVVTVLLVLLGVGDEILLGFIAERLAQVFNMLSGVFAVVIAIDLVVVGFLAVVENTIEIVTGDSADFRNGKLITMTREERIAQRRQEIERQRKAHARKRESSRDAKTAPPQTPSIYRLPLPIPGEPGEVPITPLQRVMVEDDDGSKLPQLKERAGRAGADVVFGSLQGETRRQLQGERPQLPPSSKPGNSPDNG